MNIPKILHFMWLGDKPMPQEFSGFVKGWSALHLDWSLFLWTDRDLPPLVNQEMFDSASFIVEKSDILRFELLNRFGGVYLDADVECFKNINPLLETIYPDTTCFLGMCDAQAGHVPNVAIMGSVRGDPYVRHIVNSLPSRIPLRGSSYKPSVTGPYWAATKQMLSGFPHVTLIDKKYVNPYGSTEKHRRYEDFKSTCPEAFCAHHWAGTWLNGG